MAPSAASGGAPARGGGAPANGAAANALNAAVGSRLNGLSPYPGGVMPGGGAGLRGTLVGCANPNAVGLSSVERAHCLERLGYGAVGQAHYDGISAAKRAAYDAAAARGAISGGVPSQHDTLSHAWFPSGPGASAEPPSEAAGGNPH